MKKLAYLVLLIVLCGLVVNADDRSILMNLYAKTNGPSWTNIAGWGTPANFCTWYGVECDANNTIIGIQLDWNNLNGTIPASLGNLTSLTYLTFRGNALTGAIPDFGNLQSLNSLVLYSNDITSVSPSIFALPSLVSLDLSYNNISGPFPEFGNNTKLEYLVLSDNQFTGPVSDSICQLTALRNLYLGSPGLSGSLPACMGQLTNLISLSIRNTQLTGSLSWIGQLINLVQLYLENNQFSGSLPDSFGNLTNLAIVNIVSNQFSGPIPNLGKCQNMLYLVIERNQFTGNIDWLPLLKRLSSISLSYNNFNGQIPASIELLTNLNSFEAVQSGLSGPIPPGLFGGPAMSTILIGNGDFTGSLPNWMSPSIYSLEIFATNMSGSIPSSIGKMQSLRTLQLSQNQFTGSIPASFARLYNLYELDLSYNQLSGEIPSFLGTLYNLEILDLHHNQFTGMVPNLDNIADCDITYNMLQCSKQKGLCVSTCYDTPCAPIDNTGAIVGGIFGFGGLAALVVGGVVLYRRNLIPNISTERRHLLKK